jgi:hypothetical protein
MLHTILGCICAAGAVFLFSAAVMMTRARYEGLPEEAVFPAAISRWAHVPMTRSIGSARMLFLGLGSLALTGALLWFLG